MKSQHLLQRLEMHAYIRKDSCKNTPKCPQDKAKTVFSKEGEGGGRQAPFFFFFFNLTKQLHLKQQQAYQESNSKITNTNNK